jgi:hypothetical protein
MVPGLLRIFVIRKHVQNTGERKKKGKDEIGVGQRGHSVERVNGIFARERYFLKLIQLNH